MYATFRFYSCSYIVFIFIEIISNLFEKKYLYDIYEQIAQSRAIACEMIFFSSATQRNDALSVVCESECVFVLLAIDATADLHKTQGKVIRSRCILNCASNSNLCGNNQ